jgi:bacterioferritin
MKADAIVIKHLNKAFGNELIAINQYFLHSRMYREWGLPNLQNLGKLMMGEHTREMLECDLKLEMHALPVLKEGIAHAESVQDYVSRDLLAAILRSEEEHVDWLETQLQLIDKIGIENYQQSMI